MRNFFFISFLPSFTKSCVESLPNEVLTVISRKLFTLRHYGFFHSQFPNNVKIPSSLQIRCWEVNEPEKWFPSEELGALRARRMERENLTEECFKLLQGMTDAQKTELVGGSKDQKDTPSKSASTAEKSALSKDIQVGAIEFCLALTSRRTFLNHSFASMKAKDLMKTQYPMEDLPLSSLGEPLKR